MFEGLYAVSGETAPAADRCANTDFLRDAYEAVCDAAYTAVQQFGAESEQAAEAAHKRQHLAAAILAHTPEDALHAVSTFAGGNLFARSFAARLAVCSVQQGQLGATEVAPVLSQLLTDDNEFVRSTTHAVVADFVQTRQEVVDLTNERRILWAGLHLGRICGPRSATA